MGRRSSGEVILNNRMDIPLLEKILKCPCCEHELSYQDSAFSCRHNHFFPASRQSHRLFRRIPALVRLQEWTRRSFESEWCHYYPRLGWQSGELAREIDMFLTYTRSMPNFFFNKIVVDAGCGNGRYINVVNAMCSTRPRLLIGIELSDNAFLASGNCSEFDNVVILKMNLNDLPKVLREPAITFTALVCCTTHPMRLNHFAISRSAQM